MKTSTRVIELGVNADWSRKYEDTIGGMVEKQTKHIKTWKDAKSKLIGLLKLARWESSKLMSQRSREKRQSGASGRQLPGVHRKACGSKCM